MRTIFFSHNFFVRVSAYLLGGWFRVPMILCALFFADASSHAQQIHRSTMAKTDECKRWAWDSCVALTWQWLSDSEVLLKLVIITVTDGKAPTRACRYQWRTHRQSFIEFLSENRSSLQTRGKLHSTQTISPNKWMALRIIHIDFKFCLFLSLAGKAKMNIGTSYVARNGMDS